MRSSLDKIGRSLILRAPYIGPHEHRGVRQGPEAGQEDGLISLSREKFYSKSEEVLQWINTFLCHVISSLSSMFQVIFQHYSFMAFFPLEIQKCQLLIFRNALRPTTGKCAATTARSTALTSSGVMEKIIRKYNL